MVIPATNVIQGAGLGRPLRSAGALASAANEVQSIAGTATGGSAPFTFKGQSTPAQAFNVTAANLQAALAALSTIGAGNVICTGGPLGTAAIVVTFGGALADAAQPLITVGAGLTGGTATVTETTAGTAGFGVGAPTGALATDTIAGVLYQNQGTAAAPTWVKVGGQA